MQTVRNSTPSAARPLAETPSASARARSTPAQDDSRPAANAATGTKVTVSQEAQARLNAENRANTAAQQARANDNTRKAEDTAATNANRRRTDDLARMYGA